MRKANRAASIFLAFPVSLYLAFLCLLLTHHSLPIPIFIIISIVFYVLLRITGTFLGPKVSFNLEPRPSGPAAHSFVYAFLSCFLVLLLYLAAYFPGGISSDTCYQWWQIHGQSALTDWHPALHTFFLCCSNGFICCRDRLLLSYTLQDRNTSYFTTVNHCLSGIKPRHHQSHDLSLEGLCIFYLCSCSNDPAFIHQIQ